MSFRGIFDPAQSSAYCMSQIIFPSALLIPHSHMLWSLHWIEGQLWSLSAQIQQLPHPTH